MSAPEPANWQLFLRSMQQRDFAERLLFVRVTFLTFLFCGMQMFVHLYVNGLYWGLYNPSERPSAPFVAAHLGGEPEDYDVRNGEHIPRR